MYPRSYSTTCCPAAKSGGEQVVSQSVCLHVSVRKVRILLLRQGKKRTSQSGLCRQQLLSVSCNLGGEISSCFFLTEDCSTLYLCIEKLLEMIAVLNTNHSLSRQHSQELSAQKNKYGNTHRVLH